jgi:hypothetical protein
MSEQNQPGQDEQPEIEVAEQDLEEVAGGNFLMYPAIIAVIPTTFETA